MKALPIQVYRSTNIGDCTNGGISSRFESLLLVHPEGFVSIDETNPPENLVQLVKIETFGGEYMCIKPVAEPSGIGWMAGGNFAYSSDSRFNDLSKYPLSIHDRQESEDENYTYSI